MITTENPLIFMFSGQGSQYFQMGMDLYEALPVFRELMNRGDDLFKARYGTSLLSIIFADRPNRFNPPFARTRDTHPALFLIQYALARTMMRDGIQPDMLLGYSMGEYVALAVSEVMTFEDCMDLVMTQADLIENKTRPGGMLAILGQAEEFNEQQGMNPAIRVSLAGINFHGHYVVSGTAEHIERYNQQVMNCGKATMRLPISHGFHSPLVDPAEATFVAHCRRYSFQPEARCPMFSASFTREIQADNVNTDYLWGIVRYPVRFKRSMDYLSSRHPRAVYLDLGPSGTMATFVKRAIAGKTGESIVMELLSPYRNSAVARYSKLLGAMKSSGHCA